MIREDIARIVDEEAFDDVSAEPRIIRIRAEARRREALAKADQIIALSGGGESRPPALGEWRDTGEMLDRDPQAPPPFQEVPPFGVVGKAPDPLAALPLPPVSKE
jgi:hypothetical protein